ncbi:MAG: c-type cytochrome [Fidelibacterota bacterium]
MNSMGSGFVKVLFTFVGFVAAVGVVGKPALSRGMTGLTDSNQDTAPPVVTPVTGSNWIRQIGLRNPGRSAMGKRGGKGPSPAPKKRERRIIHRIFSLYRTNRLTVPELMNETFTLTGADLYRLNCQTCHGPDGKGAPPEIKSLLDPVRGASPGLIQRRMKNRGRSIDEQFARELAASADSTLRRRLGEGGEKMPPFGHLRGDEVDALLEYLKMLAEVPVSERQEMSVEQSVARVGEHVVKGTCHICHDAVGPGGGHMAMMRGIIPSLASFPRELSVQQVIRQVRAGSSGMMRMMGGEMMPSLPYLTEEEIAASYLYLVAYPPQR